MSVDSPDFVQVVVATITTVGLIVVALVGNRARQHSKAARVQVENHHETNLRDDSDEKHKLVMAALAGVQSDIRGIRRDVGRLADADVSHNSRFNYLERKVNDQFNPRSWFRRTRNHAHR